MSTQMKRDREEAKAIIDRLPDEVVLAYLPGMRRLVHGMPVRPRDGPGVPSGGPMILRLPEPA